MTTILGLDVALNVSGWAVIEGDRWPGKLVDLGTWKSAGVSVPARLDAIYRWVSAVVEKTSPTLICIESGFVNFKMRRRDNPGETYANPKSQLLLAEARGAAKAAARRIQLSMPGPREIIEVTPQDVKRAATGKQTAGKELVSYFVQTIFQLAVQPLEDAGDAAGAALAGLLKLQDDQLGVIEGGRRNAL